MSSIAIEYLSDYFPEDTIKKLQKIKPTYWEDLKTEAINFDKNFIWLEDSPFQAELSVSHSVRRYLLKPKCS